jgi:hypothetical protein
LLSSLHWIVSQNHSPFQEKKQDLLWINQPPCF